MNLTSIRKIKKDYMLLSKNITCRKISGLLDNNELVICNLTDRDGKIGLLIKKVYFDFDKNTCNIELINGDKHYLFDKYLYNIIYIVNKDKYSLEEHDEYYEKIEIDK